MADSIKNNIIYSAIYQVLNVVLPLITAPYISRVLGVESIGIYSYTFSVANYFLLFAMLGMKNYGSRRTAQVRDNPKALSENFSSMYIVQIVMSVVLYITYICYVSIFTTEHKDIAYIQGMYVASAVVDVTWLFSGLEEFKVSVTRNLIIRIISVCCVFVFVKTKSDLDIYTFILAFSNFIGYVLLLPFVHRYVQFVKPKWSCVKVQIVPSLRLFIPVIAVSLFNIMDKIMLGKQSTMFEVGLYENAEKIMRIPLGIITAMGTVMMPHMSHVVSIGDKTGEKKKIEQSIVLVMCMACALAGGLAGVGKIFAPVFFGDEFEKCGILIMWISPTILSLSWANIIRMQYLIPHKLDKEFTISTFIGAIVNLSVNYALIPKYGALGAVIGTVCAETSLTIYQTLVAWKYLPISSYLGETAPFLVIGVFMSLAVQLIGSKRGPSITTLIIQIAVGIVVYCSLSMAYFVNSRREGVVSVKQIVVKTARKRANRL